MIAENAMNIIINLVNEDGKLNDSIGIIPLTENIYKKVALLIFPLEKDIY